MTNEVKIEEAEIWVLEHSLKQNQYHITTLERSLKSNMKSTYERRDSDWLTIGVSTTQEGIQKQADEWESMIPATTIEELLAKIENRPTNEKEN